MVTHCSWIGTKVKVAFDDGVIIGREKKKGAWITRFEDGTEDRCEDPSKDKDYTNLKRNPQYHLQGLFQPSFIGGGLWLM